LTIHATNPSFYTFMCHLFGGRERKGMIKGKEINNKKYHMKWYVNGMEKIGCQPLIILYLTYQD